MAKNEIYCMKTDGFHGELFRPEQDSYPGKVLICFSGSDGKFELSRMLAQVFQAHGLTALVLAYVMEEGLPRQFYHVPIDPLEAAAVRLHDMGYEKVGLWGISKGAELALTAGSFLPGLVNAVVAVAPMNTVCQGFSKTKGITIMSGSTWTFHGEEVPYSSYQSLFEVILSEQYDDYWIEKSASIVGDEAAEASAAALKGYISCDIYGQEAIDTYAQSGGMGFDCWYINDAKTFE